MDWGRSSLCSLATRAENLNYLIMRKYYAKTVHPELLNDLSFVISDIRDAYFVKKKNILEQFLALQPRN